MSPVSRTDGVKGKLGFVGSILMVGVFATAVATGSYVWAGAVLGAALSGVVLLWVVRRALTKVADAH